MGTRGAMRCMHCFEQMAVTAVTPADVVAMQGFAHQTLECPTCGASEVRLVFRRGLPEAPASSTGALPVEEPAATAAAPEEPAAPPRPRSAWEIAVDKLRSRQADLQQRSGEAGKEDWAAQFNRAWERLAPARTGKVPSPDPVTRRPKDLLELGRTVRARLLKRSVWSPAPRADQARPDRIASPDALRSFHQFWESLARPGAPAQEVSLDVAAPLPSSLSLVPIEAGASEAGRAILLLRGQSL
jgi:hypothetical protein